MYASPRWLDSPYLIASVKISRLLISNTSIALEMPIGHLMLKTQSIAESVLVVL
jgi:hypothetical protein